MSTKQNPGRFNCYEAAYPDETIFTLLARDPAFPATVRFWVQERLRQGKTGGEDDARLTGALADALSAEAWREANLDPLGDGVPTWRLPRQIDMSDARVPVSSLSEMVNEVCERLDDFTAGGNTGVKTAEFIASIRRDLLVGVLRGEEPLEPVEDWRHGDSDVDHLEWIHERLVKVHNENPNFDYMHRLRKVISNLHEGDTAQTPEVPVYTQGFFRVGDTVMSVAEVEAAVLAGGRPVAEEPVRSIKTHRKADPTSPSGFITLADDVEPVPYQMGTLDGFGEPAMPTPGERVLIDSAPDDLAHAPEVAPHRFATFVKGEHYAYARGLEVAPIHLPVALDAMLLDGWELVSIFGATESKHVGFIFRRLPQPVMVKYDFPSNSDGPVDDVVLGHFRRNKGTIKSLLYGDETIPTLKPGAKMSITTEDLVRSIIAENRELVCRLLREEPGAPCPEFGRQQEP